MTSRIAELSLQISSNSKTIDDFLATNSLPYPSFAENGPVTLALSPEAENARNIVLNATAELQALLTGPDELLRPSMNGTSLAAISHYDMARKVPVGGSITLQELADQCNLYEHDVRRIVRHAIAHYFVFREPIKGVVAHSAASRRLVDDQCARDALSFVFNDAYQGYGRTVEAMEKWKGQEMNQTGWALAHNGESLYQTFENEPAKAKRFAGSMAAFNASPMRSYSHVVNNFPWDDLDTATVVDLGGSHGELCIAIAISMSKLKFVVQELPRTVQSVNRDAIPSVVASRIQFMEHDFFNPQPIVAAVYVFRQIFHNWADINVVKILRNLIPALRTGARVLVHDIILPEPGKLPLVRDRHIRSFDMAMLSMCNARERDEEDWRQVFKEAHPRFDVLRVFTPNGSALGIVDVVWKEE